MGVVDDDVCRNARCRSFGRSPLPRSRDRFIDHVDVTKFFNIPDGGHRCLGRVQRQTQRSGHRPAPSLMSPRVTHDAVPCRHSTLFALPAF